MTRPASYQAQVPAVVGRYFRRFGDLAEHPIVEQEYRSEPRGIRTRQGLVTIPAGWKTIGNYRKRISVAWATKLKREGVTRVALRCGGRLADFSVDEIIRGGTAR